MDDFMNQSVTVSVITYNSSKFVLETLESIKAQTYKNLILRICDDCSMDNTVAICREWIEKNKSRFVQTDIIVPDHNTGVSANCNRAWDACTTKYMKSIAGDDVLLPNCIEDNMAYVREHPDAVLVFSRMRTFGASVEACKHSDEEVYIYALFSWSPDEQYRYLYEERNCIPAPTCFVNIQEVCRIGLRHDERIPMQEDVAKWQNALKLGIRFHFFDKLTVRYRIHNNSLSTANIISPKTIESCALFWFYYHFQPEYEINPDCAIQLAVKHQVAHYKQYYDLLHRVRNSRRLKFMSYLLYPLDMIRRLVLRGGAKG